jgi:hypothetical protein
MHKNRYVAFGVHYSAFLTLMKGGPPGEVSSAATQLPSVSHITRSQQEERDEQNRGREQTIEVQMIYISLAR